MRRKPLAQIALCSRGWADIPAANLNINQPKKMKTSPSLFTAASLRLSLLLCAFCFSCPALRAADHGDAPTASLDRSADINDVFFYLDPNDNNRVILQMTVAGFIVPAEAVNFGIFDPRLTYRFNIEGTGDTIPDAQINITFSPRTTNTTAQIATVRMTQGGSTIFNFAAPATNPSLAATAPTQVVTTDFASGVIFSAGEVDDPFTFDIVGFARFTASVFAGAPNPGHLNRARDSFAGYNTMSISLGIPRTLLPNSGGVVGVNAMTLRADQQFPTVLGNLSARGNVTTGENVLIGGIVVTGVSQKRLLVRAIGPSLGAAGVTGSLQDPTLMLVNSQAAVVASNDDWQDTQATQISLTGLAPSNENESAIIATLAPGAYTAIVSGAGGTTGVALVEAYDLEAADDAEATPLRTVDRMGIPAVNVALIPFARKDEYNSGTPQEDAAGRFADSIVGTLTALGTNMANIGILASVAVTNGDFVRLDYGIANSGPGGGDNPGAAFPNGRRLRDDTVDILLSFITNQAMPPVSDNANVNDVTLQNEFPFFANAQPPRDTGVVDDNTRN